MKLIENEIYLEYSLTLAFYPIFVNLSKHYSLLKINLLFLDVKKSIFQMFHV